MGIPLEESIVGYNDTLHDYPELNYFYKVVVVLYIVGYVPKH